MTQERQSYSVTFIPIDSHTIPMVPTWCVGTYWLLKNSMICSLLRQ